MRIERIEIKGVGPFEDAVLDIPPPEGPGELVLFEGPNGSGKTTLAHFLAVCAAHRQRESPMRESEVDGAFGSYALTFPPEQRSMADQVHHTNPPISLLLARRRDQHARIDACLGHEGDHLRVRFGPTFFHHAVPEGTAESSQGRVSRRLAAMEIAASNQPIDLSWAAFAFQAHQKSAQMETQGPKDIQDAPLRGSLSFGQASAAPYLGQLLANLEYERVRAALYAQQGAVAAERDKMLMTAKAREDGLRRFMDAASRVLDRRVDVDFPFGKASPDLRFGGEKIPIDLLGEGLRSTMAWLSDLLVRLLRITWEDTTKSPFDQEFWLILDEVDEGLHPKMQARLFPALRELFPNARIYATTHSPFVVASVGKGYIFALRPGEQGRVRGTIKPEKLMPGQSLEWVVTEIFEARAGFVDEGTRADLAAHKRDVRGFQKTGSLDWAPFLERRARLLRLNDEVRTVVFMQETPITEQIRSELERAQSDAPGASAA